MDSAIAKAATALCWSQWGHLGVSASGSTVPERAIDLEAALAFLPVVEHLDRRLFDEAIDWCVQFAGHFTSVSCLKHVLKFFTAEHQRDFARIAATVNKYGGTKWPSAKNEAVDVKLSRKSVLRLDKAAAIQLRARKTFGINARADLITVMLLENVGVPEGEHRWFKVSGLQDLPYSRRQLSDALQDLKMGGVVGTLEFGTTRYALRQIAPLRELLAPLPNKRGQPWTQRLALVAGLLHVERTTRDKSDVTRAVDTRNIVERMRPRFEAVEEAPPHLLGDRTPWLTIADWLVPLLRP
ncbi:MAG TPA: hypothetical protein VGM39_11645 [Kofleriaceae bacterium]|jgi:hypothetical protein